MSPAFDAQPSRLLPDPCAPLSFRSGTPIFQTFLEQAERAPGAIALRWGAGTCSYAELEQISRRIAQQLCARGVTPGQSVAILAERGAALVYAMLGALRAGATFYVADAAYPAARIESCVSQLQPSFLLVCNELPIPDSMLAAVGGNQERVLRLCASPSEFLGQSVATADVALGAVDAARDAYVMFTSGSTGTPKAVVTSHPPLVHFVAWHARTQAFDASDRFSMLSGLSHDPVLRDIFTPLSLGATVCIPSQATLFNPALLADWLRTEGVTVCHLTPALGEIILQGAESSGASLPALRALFWGGDALSQKTSQRVRVCAPNAKQVNFYGATETPQAMGFYTIDPNSSQVMFPIGRGIDDVQLLLVNEAGAQCAVGELGEVWVRTPYLSNGYKGDAARTQSRFTSNPFSGAKDDVCYRTGDLGRYLDSGDIALAGRADHQVKIRGFRVEPAEIAAAIERVAGVARAVVIAKELPAGKALVAYFTKQAGAASEPSPSDVKQAVARDLPAYMVPAFAIALQAFPLLPNGKIDLGALPSVETSDAGRPSFAPPATDQERKLVEIWREVLHSDKVGVNDSFLDVGGDSLSALVVMMRMQKLGLPESVAQGILQGRTIRELAGGAAPSGKLSAQAETNLLVNIVRGVLVMLIVTEHWLAGFRPELLEALQPHLGFLFGLATPGFAVIFGVSLGYSYFGKYMHNREQAVRSLSLGVRVLSAAIAIGGFVRVAVVLLQAGTIDSTRFFQSFLSVLLYYLLAMSTVRLWFAFVARFKNPYIGSVALIVLFLVASRVVWAAIGELSLSGFLNLAQTLLVAKFNYFKMSAGVLCGMMGGIFLKKHGRPPALLPTLAVALAALGLGLGLLQRIDGSLVRVHDGDDMRLWRWLFCAGAILCMAAFASDVIKHMRSAPLTRGVTQLTAVIGQCALPFFVLHVLVLDLYTLLQLVHVPRPLALLLTVGPFLVGCGWMVARIYNLYYGNTQTHGDRPSLHPSAAV